MWRKMALGSLVLGLAACHVTADAERSSGRTIDKRYDVSAFDRIAVGGPFDVTVTTGKTLAVRARGDEALLRDVEVIVEGGTLKIRSRHKSGWRVNWGHDRGSARFDVFVPALHSATIAGSGNLDVDRVQGDFEAKVAGSGDLGLGRVDGGKVDLMVAGSGNIRSAGTARSLGIKIAGSGDVDAAALSSKDAEVTVAGSGNVRARVTDHAAIKIVGSGDVTIDGGARCEVHKAGSGDAHCS